MGPIGRMVPISVLFRDRELERHLRHHAHASAVDLGGNKPIARQHFEYGAREELVRRLEHAHGLWIHSSSGVDGELDEDAST